MRIVLTTLLRAGWFFYCPKREVVGVAGGLNGRQQLFVLEFLVDRNAEQAAIRAGYSPKYARGNAHKLVANSCIAAEIKRLTAKTAEKLEISREWVMQELRYVAGARLSDFVRVESEPSARLIIHPLTGEVVPMPSDTQQVRITDTDKLPENKAAALAGIKQGANGIELKLHDKVRALELLGKALGVFDVREAPTDANNNLFEAIVESAQEELGIDDIPEIEQTPAAGNDVVEPPGVQKP